MSDLKEAWIIVDFKIIKNRNKCTLMLNQTSYVMKVLLEKEMRDCLHVEILMKSKLFIILDKLNNAMKVSTVNLQWIVEKLIIHCI